MQRCGNDDITRNAKPQLDKCAAACLSTSQLLYVVQLACCSCLSPQDKLDKDDVVRQVVVLLFSSSLAATSTSKIIIMIP